MKRHFNYLIFLTLLASCGFSDDLSRDVNLYESTSNHIPRHFKKILVCGTGEAATRLFVEKLSDKLNSQFNRKSIETTYSYLGDREQIADSLLSGLRKEALYDGYLFFFQKDLQSSISKQSDKSKNAMNNFNEILGVKLFDADVSGKEIWDANLKIHTDLTDEKFYTDVSAIIIKRLSENKILQ